MTIKAAGMLLLTAKDGRALFLRRADTGLWAFPGGQIEAGETAEQAAEREVGEEIGAAAHGDPQLWMRRIKVDGVEEVDFTTFVAKVADEFIPTLNDEHTAWTWASVTDPPQPLHPGAAVALDRLTMDELGIARTMAAGDLTSPQKYGNIWIFSIRITGTGLAYRAGRDELCWRDPSLYLDPEFLARCNGLPVILDHPDEKPSLDSKEFKARIIGTTFLPYIVGDEVWAVVKIYDDDAAGMMLDEQLSTSPAVVFRDAKDTNETLTMSNGSTLLIEGKPALLDHIAIVTAGVWDKGGPPTGVLNTTLNEGTIGMTEEEMAAADKARKDAAEKLDAIMDSIGKMHGRMDALEAADKARKDEDKERADRARHDAARKDRFGHRKDGETHKEYVARHDADEAAMCDEMEKGGDEKEAAKKAAQDARKDAEAEERRTDASFEEWAREEEREPAHRDDKARKDAGAEAAKEKERADRARHDSMNQENADLRQRLAAAEAAIKSITAETPASERDALATAQSRADSVAAMFG